MLQIGKVSFAQNDTTKHASVSIISSYKPVLRFAAKTNFYPSQYIPDSTNKFLRPYVVPAQNLNYGYQSVLLPSMELVKFRNDYLNNNYIKIGYGNYSSPLLDAGFNYNKLKNTLLHAAVEYNSSKGIIENQDYSLFAGKIDGSYFVKKHEIYSAVQFKSSQYYLYGYDHDKFDFSKNDITHPFNDFTYNIGLHNTEVNSIALNYDPNVSFNAFSMKDSINESTIKIAIPFECHLSKIVTATLNSNIDLTNVSIQNKNLNDTAFSNNIIDVTPAVHFSHSLFSIDAGLMFSSVDKKMILFPQLLFEMPIKKYSLIFKLGVLGQVYKNTYRNLTAINPYLVVNKPIENASSVDYFGAVNASLGKHVFVNVKLGFIMYKNYAIMVNDTSAADEKMNQFIISKEDKFHDVTLHADFSYVLPEKIRLSAGCTINAYGGLENNMKAYNLPVFEANATFDWMINRKVSLSTNLYLFGGGSYLDKDAQAHSIKGAIDLATEISYRFHKRISAFIKINNIFGDKYERWHNYPVYGINGIGGVKFSF